MVMHRLKRVQRIRKPYQAIETHHSHMCTRLEFGATLSDDDVPGLTSLAAVQLDTQHLGLRASTISG